MRSTITKRILAETPKETKLFVSLYADIVVRVNQILKAKNWSQKDLAERIGKRPSEISKWLKGEHNFTLKSIAKLQAELDEPIISVADDEIFINSEEKSFKKGFTVVHRNKNYKNLPFENSNMTNQSKHKNLVHAS